VSGAAVCVVSRLSADAGLWLLCLLGCASLALATQSTGYALSVDIWVRLNALLHGNVVRDVGVT
jgi:hypothetical protein